MRLARLEELERSAVELAVGTCSGFAGGVQSLSVLDERLVSFVARKPKSNARLSTYITKIA